MVREGGAGAQLIWVSCTSKRRRRIAERSKAPKFELPRLLSLRLPLEQSRAGEVRETKKGREAGGVRHERATYLPKLPGDEKKTRLD